MKDGLYAADFGGGQVDITNGKFVFSCTEAYRIKDGKVGAPVKGATLIGNGPDSLQGDHDRQRHGARPRHRHLRQEGPERAGGRGAADVEVGGTDGGRDRGVTIRQAAPAEAPLLAAIVEAAYAPWVPIIGRRPMPMEDDYAARIAAGEAWVLEAAGRVQALVVIERHADHLLLDNIAVDPRRQGHGDGRALLEFVDAEAGGRGWRRCGSTPMR